MWTDAATPLSTLKSTLDDFNQARDWGQFHTPKDLAMCISVESGELLECFLWKKPSEGFLLLFFCFPQSQSRFCFWDHKYTPPHQLSPLCYKSHCLL